MSTVADVASPYERILYAVEDGVATITFNFPEKRNAMRRPMVAEFGQALARAEEDAAVQAVILTGAGEHFSAGGDMSAASGPMTVESGLTRMRTGSRVSGTLLEFSKPVIAAVDGCAFGAGFSFALGADLIIASDRARFCLAFMRMGLVPDAGALFTLPRLIGMQRARELIYSAREIDAATALAYGLVLEVVAPAALHARAVEIARAMTGLSPVAFGVTKAALLRSMSSDLASMLDVEMQGQSLAFVSDYAQDVGARFRAKQPPRFKWPERQEATQQSQPQPHPLA